VLPHEALPSNEDYGYIHIQGAFTPKIVILSSNSSSTNKDESTNDGDVDEKEKDKDKDKDKENYRATISLPDAKMLESIMMKAFQGVQVPNDSKFNSNTVLQQQIPHTNIISIEILSDSSFSSKSASITTSTSTAVFTKARLCYPSPAIARDVVSFLRSTKVTPSMIFQQSDISININVNTDTSEGEGESEISNNYQYKYQYSSKAIQATQVTQNPLPPASIGWPKVGPPKFRRLLPHNDNDNNNGGENISGDGDNDDSATKLALERSQTRFLFMTNIIVDGDGDYSNDDNDSTNNDEDSNSNSDIYSRAIISDEELISNPYLIQDALRNAIQPYCTSTAKSRQYPVEIYLLPKKKQQSKSLPFKYCHIGTRCNEDVQLLLQNLQGRVLELKVQLQKLDKNNNTTVRTRIIRTGQLFLDHASITQRCEAKLRSSRNNNSCTTTTNNNIGSNDQNEINTKGEPTRPECTSTTESIHVPGLVLVPDFVSTEEEGSILAVLIGPNAPWAPEQQNFSKTGAVKRRVQHYGYVFDYQTANVLRDRNCRTLNACCPPMPALPKSKDNKDDDDDDNLISSSWSRDALDQFCNCAVKEGRGWDVLASVIERVRRFEFKNDGCTSNSNTGSSPGTSSTSINNGDESSATNTEIPSGKVITTSASAIKSPSETSARYPFINQMTVNEYKRGQGIGSHIDTKSAFADGLISVSLGADCVMEFREQTKGTRKLVHLPPRSLLLMSGPARYSWEHMIVSRGTDFVNGKVLPRKTRISLTLRTAITLPDDKDNDKNTVRPLDLVESDDFPPRWGNGAASDSSIATPLTEKQHVHAVYDAIAKQWHHTRGKRGVLWPGATSFLKSLPRGSVVADIGCGDGKYFPAIWNSGSFVIGTDISLPLLETSVGACLSEGEQGPELRQVRKQNSSYNTRPAVAVADCMHIPLRSNSCDAAICIAVMHHLSTRPRRIRCLKELARIVKKGGTVNVQAWAFEQENNSRRKFAGTDVFVPFNSQPRYLDKVSHETKKKKKNNLNEEKREADNTSSVAEMYSKAYDGAEYDDRKGLVVFQRYCHMYREGELEGLVQEVGDLEVLESGFETGNHFVIFKVV